MQNEAAVLLMTEQDLEQVLRIEEHSFTVPWTEKDFLDAIKNDYYCFVVSKFSDGEIVGYCGLYQSDTDAYITNVAVAEKYRRKRIAEKMLNKLIEIGNLHGIINFTLEVRVSNKPAINLYKKLGFNSVGIRKNFYREPEEDANIMWLYG